MCVAELGSLNPRDRLLGELRRHSVVVGDFVLASGRRADYYVDVRRTLLRPAGIKACGRLAAERAKKIGVQAVGGMTLGADPIVCGAIADDEGAQLTGFLVRKERKVHGLERYIEGPPLSAGTPCLIVEDVVTTGGSTVDAIAKVRDAGMVVAGVMAVVDRLAGGGDAIREALAEGSTSAAYESVFTIDDVFPDRPDSGSPRIAR